MNDDTMITQQDIDDAEVRLRPVLGIAPRLYVAGLYGLALIAAVFMILLYPGLRRPGATYSFNADPPGSAVFIDGAYVGYAPCELFVPAGEHELRVSRPGFADHAASMTTKGRVFGTLIVKPREDLFVSLGGADVEAVLSGGIERYATWALAGTPSESYQIPMDLSDAVRAAGVVGDRADGLLGAAASYARHSQSLRDAARAASIAYGGSAAVTPASAGRLVAAVIGELRDDPAILTVLAELGPETVRRRLEPTGAYRAALGASDAVVEPVAGRSSMFAGEEFVPMGGGVSIVKAGSALPAVSELGPFWLASSETTVGRYRRFVAERPEWAPSAAASLAADGLADDAYLADFGEAADSDPIRYVSKPAAEAYCDWLSEYAPAGYRFALPTEAQWSYAAAASGASASAGAALLDGGRDAPLAPALLRYDAAGLRGMLGNVWEWCADSYAPHPAAGVAGRLRFPSPEAVVRGGSWANRADLVTLSSRGPVRTSGCNAYLGFRVAMVPAER